MPMSIRSNRSAEKPTSPGEHLFIASRLFPTEICACGSDSEAGRLVVRAYTPELRLGLRAFVGGSRTTLAKRASERWINGVGRLAHDDHPLPPPTEVGTAITSSSACVWGYRGSLNTVSVWPISTILPRYVTATRSVKYAAVAGS